MKKILFVLCLFITCSCYNTRHYIKVHKSTKITYNKSHRGLTRDSDKFRNIEYKYHGKN